MLTLTESMRSKYVDMREAGKPYQDIRNKVLWPLKVVVLKEASSTAGIFQCQDLNQVYRINGTMLSKITFTR